MKIKLKKFKEKSFLIPLSVNGQWVDYKQFKANEWRQNIINVLRIVLTASNTCEDKEQISKMAAQQVDMFVQNIKENLSPQKPCLALAFEPARCWFVAFIVEAFLPLENINDRNIFEKKYYSDTEQTIAIVKSKGDVVPFDSTYFQPLLALKLPA